MCSRSVGMPYLSHRDAVSRAEASAEKNRELVEIEDQLNAQKRARDAATEAERARVAALQQR